MKVLFILVGLMISISQAYAQTYPNNETGQYEDMLTPEYYNTPNGGTFRNEINKFVHFARLTPFQHPLGQITYTNARGFGDGIGLNNASQHHNALDMHVGNNDSNVVLFASIEGTVSTYRNASKYRDYLTITNNVKDSLGGIIGKIVVLYGHIDLNLDSTDNRLLNGQNINKGDTVSKHLYSGTLGGAHLHFEIRYYRTSDNGIDDFYNWQNNSPTTVQSSGPWSYGYWNPNLGYGFAHPNNHLNYAISLEEQAILDNNLYIYPNPVKDYFTINYPNKNTKKAEVYNAQGQLVKTLLLDGNPFKYDISEYKRGVYLIKIGGESLKILKE